MTKKKEKQPRGRPAKKNKEIFKGEMGGDDVGRDNAKIEIKEKPEFATKAPKEEKLAFEKPAAQAKEKNICATCKGELSDVIPKFCPNCGIELNRGA